MATCGYSGWVEITKCSSGVFVYMQVLAYRNSPSRAGTYLETWLRMNSTSSSWTSRSMVSGSAGLPSALKNAALTPPPWPVVGRYRVERVAVLGLPDKDGESVGEKRFDAPYRVEPEQDLARDLQREAEVSEQL